MPEQRRKDAGPPKTRAIEVAQTPPQPNVAGLFVSGEPLPNDLTVRLCVEAGPRAGAVIPLTLPVTVLGRGAAYADVELDDEAASRRHAFIVHKAGVFSVADMGSTNGTTLNGKVIGQCRLQSGDRIQIGAAVLRFEIT